MPPKKFMSAAYQKVRGNDTVDRDIEANAEERDLDEQQNKKVKDSENNGAEAVPMKILNGGNENSEAAIGSNNTGSRTDIGNELCESPVMATNKMHDSRILNFAKKGDVEGCRKLVAQPNVDVNLRGKKEVTALHLAAQNGHEEIVALLLRHGADKFVKDSDEFLPLHYAARYGYLKCVQYLLRECSCDDQQLSEKTKWGRTALMEAANFGCLDCCNILLGRNVDEVDCKKNTALHYAARGGHEKIVEILLKNNADPRNQNSSGRTPLHEAASQKAVSCLELLFNVAQPDVLQVDERGKNILHFAVKQKSAKCLNYLLDKDFIKANIDKCEGPAGTPLLYAMSCWSYECATALLQAGASPSLECNGTYPIFRAAENGFHLVCEELLAIDDAVLNQRNNHKQTPLHMAVKSCHIETVDLICNKMNSARISLSDEDDLGQTALHMAVKKADEKIVRRLLRGNISMTKQDLRGFTALHLAAAQGKKKCCEILLEKGSTNLHKYNKNGFFPVDLAFQNMDKNQESIIFLLKETFPKIKKNHKLFVNVMLMKCRMQNYMSKALEKKLRNVVAAIIESFIWKDSLQLGEKLQENFKKLVEVYPDLALKAQGKYIKSESTETTFEFAHFESNYYMEEKKSLIDNKMGKLKKKDLQRHPGIYSWAEELRPFDDNGKLKRDALECQPDVCSWAENHPVNHFITNNESKLLKHPVTQAWLRHKWNSYTIYIHHLLLILEGSYLGFLVWYMATTWNWIHISNAFNITKVMFCNVSNELYAGTETFVESSLLDTTASKSIRDFEEKVDHLINPYYLVFITWIIKVFLEFFYLYRLRHLYWGRNMLPNVLIAISQLLLTMVLLFVPFGMCYNQRPGILQEDWSWQCGIFAVLFAWMHLINSVNQAHKSVFLPITKDFLEILVKMAYFLVNIIAIFAFIFHLLLSEQDSFGSFFQSIGSTLVWMLLDLGYTDTFVEKQLSYPVLSNVIFFLFITTIGFLIVSLISKERTRKNKGKELDDDYRRLVTYTNLIFRYEICCPRWIRRRFTVNKVIETNQNHTFLEYYLGEIGSEGSEADVTYDNEVIVERINKLESIMLDISDQITHLRLQQSKKHL